jgi:hypothetical protein
MTTFSRLLRGAASCAAVAVVAVILSSTAVRSQPSLEEPAVVSLDSLPPLEQARQFLIARQFEAALSSAEDAAASMGISAAAVFHAPYSSAEGDTASVHLYRGLALELLRRFPEARADYDVVLALEPESWRAAELRVRYPYVAGQALRSRARDLRDDGVTPDTGVARYGVGSFPFYNASSILVMSQVSYGLTGVVNNSLGLLDYFSDQPIARMPYWQTRILLDEILPEEVYGAGATVDVDGLSRVLEVGFLTSGVLDEVSGSLIGEATVGSFSPSPPIQIDELQAGYTAIGLLDLQRSLILTVADSIQARTGFGYVPSRQAFADSIETYLIDDVGRLLTYGFALEQLLLGEIIEAQALMVDLPDRVAQLDLEQIDEMVAHATPPVDNVLSLTAVSAAAVPIPSPPTVVDTLAADTAKVGEEPTDDVTVQQHDVRNAHVLSSAAGRSLGAYSVWGPTIRSHRFDELQRKDPREGVAGALDPTRIEVSEPGVPVQVVIPLPTQPESSGTDGQTR